MNLSPYMNSLLSIDKNQLSARKLAALMSALVALYSFARVGVLFFEALAIVREERSQDYELLELCARGDARSSPKMRDACLKARAERASPLVAKAIVYAVSTAFKDFSNTVGSPFKFSVVCLFLVSSVMLPIIPWAKAIFGTKQAFIQCDNGFDAHPNHILVMAPSSMSSNKLKWKKRIGRHIPQLLRSRPVIEEVEDPYAHEEDELQVHMHQD